MGRKQEVCTFGRFWRASILLFGKRGVGGEIVGRSDWARLVYSTVWGWADPKVGGGI